jgi:hypothetical protein
MLKLKMPVETVFHWAHRQNIGRLVVEIHRTTRSVRKLNTYDSFDTSSYLKFQGNSYSANMELLHNAKTGAWNVSRRIEIFVVIMRLHSPHKVLLVISFLPIALLIEQKRSARIAHSKIQVTPAVSSMPTSVM